MKARLTVGPNYEGMLGHFLVMLQFEKHSLCEADGMSISIFLCVSAALRVRYSLLPALSICGMVYTKVVQNSFTTELFLDFLRGLLDQMNPFPADKSLIVMDNAKIHRNPRIRELIETRYILTNQLLAALTQHFWTIEDAAYYTFQLILQI